ncbi:hypothetical protein H0H87_006364, partial [Tephrocybe sp. NHM501043]
MCNVPRISLEAYLLCILKYCPMTNKVFLILLVYFDRMSKLSSNAVSCSFIIALFNIHHLAIAGITIASKFFSNIFYTILHYAKVGGLPLAELNQLKLQLLLNNFCLIISSVEMQCYTKQLILFSSANPQTQQNLQGSMVGSMAGSIASALDMSSVYSGCEAEDTKEKEEGQVHTPAQLQHARTSSSSSSGVWDTGDKGRD